MSTITENKKPVTANWQTTKVQAEVVKSVATLYGSLETILAKENPQILPEVSKLVLINKAYYATLPIQTPTDLVTAISEYAANVLGTKVAVVSDANKPSIVFEGATFPNKLAQIINIPPSQVPVLIDYFKNGIIDLGAQFGFKTEIATAEPDFIVTFSK